VKNVDGDIEKVSMEEFLERVAPNYKIDGALIAIQKKDFLNECDGCIEDPLRLKDTGFAWIRDWSMRYNSVVVELCFIAICIFTAAFAVVPLFQKKPILSTISIVGRSIRIISIAYVLRPLFHVFTSYPAPSLECQGRHVRGGNSDEELCSYNGFSPHALQAALMLFLLFRYVRQMFSSTAVQLTWLVSACILFLLQIFLVLAFRLCYSVDVVESVVLVIAFGEADCILFPRAENYAEGEDANVK